MEPIPTMEWTVGSLKLLDQRVLPDREDYIECTDVEQLAEAIVTLAVRGAPAIGIAAAYGCVLAAMNASRNDYEADFHRRLGVLAGTRPTAVNLFHCIEIQKDMFSRDPSPEAAPDTLLSSAHRMFHEDLEASRRMGEFGADLLKEGSTVLTHCNAGGLATAGLGTALAVIYEGWNRGLIERVYADETRPLLQGARLTAWELCRAGIPVLVQPDSAAASLLLSGEVDAVIVGSDRVAANGDAANKIGTLSLALAAESAGVPFYVAAPVTTFDIGTATGAGIRIEQRGREELASLGGKTLIPADALVHNPAFDVTPAELITAIICEKGVLEPGRDSMASVL